MVKMVENESVYNLTTKIRSDVYEFMTNRLKDNEADN